MTGRRHRQLREGRSRQGFGFLVKGDERLGMTLGLGFQTSVLGCGSERLKLKRKHMWLKWLNIRNIGCVAH